jgi:hypothetical protein
MIELKNPNPLTPSSPRREEGKLADAPYLLWRRRGEGQRTGYFTNWEKHAKMKNYGYSFL